MMPLTLEGLIVSIVAAGICGAVGKWLVGEKPGGPIGSVTVGVIGGLLVSWGAHALHLSEPVGLHVPGRLAPLAWAMIGTVLFVAVPVLTSAGRISRAAPEVARPDGAAAGPWVSGLPEAIAVAASL